VADQQPVARQHLAAQPVAVLGRHADLLVLDARVVHLGHDRRRQVLQPLEPMERLVGLDRDHAHAGRALVQVASGADDGAGRAQAAHEVRDASARLLPDLGPGRAVVRERVGGAAVLVRVPVALGLLGHRRRTAARAPSDPSNAAVNVIDAPYARHSFLRSSLTLSGMKSSTA
jgi:hypothetical protein